MTWKFDDIELHFKFSKNICRPNACLLQKGDLSIKDEVIDKFGCISLPTFKILALFSDTFIKILLMLVMCHVYCH